MTRGRPSAGALVSYPSAPILSKTIRRPVEPAWANAQYGAPAGAVAGSAWLLHKQGHALTVFEAADYQGGHANTVDVTLETRSAPIDTGFRGWSDARAEFARERIVRADLADRVTFRVEDYRDHRRVRPASPKRSVR